MIGTASSVNQTVCHIREIIYCLPVAPCDRCHQPAVSYTTAERVAIDVNLEYPVLLHITVSVHHCVECSHYFRAQPPFLQHGAIYTNRVVDKAVRSVHEDGMAMRCTTTRLARDFWVRPSEGTIRRWCRAYGQAFDFATDYQPWVVREFSGILCVDEVYQDRLALLLAVDPAAPDGDRLVGYQLVHEAVDAKQVERFLADLKGVGIAPDEVITDGSQLYPSVLTKIWPKAAHQLCLFHETRHVTKAAMKAITAIRKRLPRPPPAPGVRGGGTLRNHPPGDDPTHPDVQRWYWRQSQRHIHISRVHELAQQGLSLRAIARQTGHHRQTIKRWLRQSVPPTPDRMPADLSGIAAQNEQQKQGPERQVRLLIDPTESTVNTDSPKTLPPAPWSSWEEARQVREALQKHRFLLLHRSEHLTPEEQEDVTHLLNTPIGAALQVVRSFLQDWYYLWMDKDGRRRSVAEAQMRYEAWRTNATYRAVSQLRHAQEQMNAAKFEHLSQFLRHPEWEATNNGAERAGRAFRHRQAPHFNLRNPGSIDRALNLAASLRQEHATATVSERLHTCQRGRKRACLSGSATCAMAA